MEFDNEQVFSGEVDLRYLFYSFRESPFVVVAFSAWSAPGSPPAYNLLGSLQPVSHNKLFILDDYGIPEHRGCYYLGFNGDFQVERSVIALIDEVRISCGVPRENVICCGSSKGAFASLYFAVKYGLGAAIVAAPQILLGDYLLTTVNLADVAEYMSGCEGEEAREMLNSMMTRAVEKAKYHPLILIHAGTKDPCYWNHILHFEKLLLENGFPYQLDLLEYNSHGDVNRLVAYYQSFLQRGIAEFVESKSEDSENASAKSVSEPAKENDAGENSKEILS